MANHVSALKRARQNEKRRTRNRAGRAANRTVVRKFEAALADGNAAALLPEAMAQLASAVHLVTTDGPGGRAGLTATSVCSVSDGPPTLLVVGEVAAFAAVRSGET